MFFPNLIRGGGYAETRSQEYFADYGKYRADIERDCKSRCIYCDVHLDECGGEGMHLDHFRPQKHFANLTRSPYNLVLACAKCNILKSKHWPLPINEDGPSHNGSEGFIDPFAEHLDQFYEIEADGALRTKKGPAPWVIELLQLNRNSRVQIRRARMMRAKIDELNGQLTTMLSELTDLLALPDTDKEEQKVKLALASFLQKKIAELHENMCRLS